MFTFEEYVMFSELSEDMKKQLAEKFAAKLLPPDEVRVLKQLGSSYVDAWAHKQLEAY